MAQDGGLSRFQKRMRAIPEDVRKAVRPALLKSAEEVAGAMRSLAPEDEGDLKESITVTGPGEQTPAYSQPGGSQAAKENEAIVTVGNSDVRYPHLVEYGTAHAPAQPFFWPAYRSLRKRSESRIKREMTKAIKKHWGKG